MCTAETRKQIVGFFIKVVQNSALIEQNAICMQIYFKSLQLTLEAGQVFPTHERIQSHSFTNNSYVKIWFYRQDEMNQILSKFFKVQYYKEFIILFISADLQGSGSAIALSVNTCLIRHTDFLTSNITYSLEQQISITCYWKYKSINTQITISGERTLMTTWERPPVTAK